MILNNFKCIMQMSIHTRIATNSMEAEMHLITRVELQVSTQFNSYSGLNVTVNFTNDQQILSYFIGESDINPLSQEIVNLVEVDQANIRTEYNLQTD